MKSLVRMPSPAVASAIEAITELSKSFLHDIGDDPLDKLEGLDYCKQESDTDGDVYVYECDDCGKSLFIKNIRNLDNEETFVPFAINNGIPDCIEDCFHMFCDVDLRFVYAITDTRRQFLKIGSSQNPNQRIKELQTSSPYELEIRHFFIGDKSDEKKAQIEFADLRTDAKNEWFKFDKRILEYFDQRCTVEGFWRLI